MSLEIWKYEVPVSQDEFILDMPEDAQPLTVQVQPAVGGVMLWVLVNPEDPVRHKTFRLLGTGHPIAYQPHDLRYIGSFQLEQGTLVFHLFEVLPAPF